MMREVEERAQKAKAQTQREREVEEILRKRPDESVIQDSLDEVGRTSVEVSELLSQRFGKVQK